MQQYVDEIEIKEVELKVYYSLGTEISYLYEDAHNGYEYEQGEIRYSTLHYTGTADGLTIRQDVEGAFMPPYKSYRINLIGMPDTSRKVHVDGREIQGEPLVPITFKELIIEW